MRSKQAVKAAEGLLPEKRFKRLVANFKYRSGGKYVNFVNRLEMQLAVVLVRTGLAISPFQARQLLASGSVFVNNVKVCRSSRVLVPGDLVHVAVRFAGPSSSGGSSLPYEHTRGLWKKSWFAFSQTKALSVVILRYPKPSELLLTYSLNPQACFAFYGKL